MNMNYILDVLKTESTLRPIGFFCDGLVDKLKGLDLSDVFSCLNIFRPHREFKTAAVLSLAS